ncbi:hypothetical protein H0H92_012534 [Tricholoma furcatifolium]|nr:hypothetical protein H0H92_012534 [Tricholoma furcatifolium]
MSDVPEPTTHLGWQHVGLGFAFILFDVAVSAFFGLGIERGLLTAAVRCVLQLAVMATVLQRVFATEAPWEVAGIAFLLNLLGTFEIVANKAKRRHRYMNSSTLKTHGPLTPLIAAPRENRDKVEMYLAFGASRMEACRPIAREALRMALTPVVNQMSVIGMISIPGMMTGALLGGSSVEQAARLQMIIMFMISSATALASFFSAIAAIMVTVDHEHRIRPDRIDNKPFALWRAQKWLGNLLLSSFECLWGKVKGRMSGANYNALPQEERELLITSRNITDGFDGPRATPIRVWWQRIDSRQAPNNTSLRDPFFGNSATRGLFGG